MFSLNNLTFAREEGVECVVRAVIEEGITGLEEIRNELAQRMFRGRLCHFQKSISVTGPKRWVAEILFWRLQQPEERVSERHDA